MFEGILGSVSFVFPLGRSIRISFLPKKKIDFPFPQNLGLLGLALAGWWDVLALAGFLKQINIFFRVSRKRFVLCCNLCIEISRCVYVRFLRIGKFPNFRLY